MTRVLWSRLRQGLLDGTDRLARSRHARWLGLLMAALLLAVLAALVYRQRELIIQHLVTADLRLLGAVFGWYTLSLAVCIAGWVLLMRALGSSLPLVEDLRIYCTANAAKRLPGSLWYVGGRAVLYAQLGIAIQSVVVASGLEAVLTSVAGILLAAPVLIFVLPNWRWVWVALSAFVVLVLLNPVVLRWVLARTVEGWTAARIPLRYIYAVVGILGLGWVFGGCLLLSIIRIFEPLPISQLPSIIGSWALAGTLSTLMLVLPSNLGVTELSLTVMLSHFVLPAVATLAALSARILITLLDLLFGGCAIAFGRARRTR